MLSVYPKMYPIHDLSDEVSIAIMPAHQSILRGGDEEGDSICYIIK